MVLLKLPLTLKKMLLNLGEFCFINNETIHSIRSPSKTIVVIFHIDLNYFEDEFQYIKQMFFLEVKCTLNVQPKKIKIYS